MRLKQKLITATILGFSLSAMSAEAATTTTPGATKHHAASKAKAKTASAKSTKAMSGSAAVVGASVGPAPARHYVAADAGEAVIVTGTHSVNKRARDSISPVKVVTAAALMRSGQPNLADALTRTYASINIEAAGADVAALTSSIHMRGLSSNEVLVLFDGKRRHTTANFTADGGPNFGTTGVDLNMIPANMIDHVEVLEDGAAAMYGSDAIAGVVNIITKKQDHGVNMSATTGANAYSGSGWQYQVNADGGMKLGSDGFLHISAQMYHADHSYLKHVDDHRLLPASVQPVGHDDTVFTGSPSVPANSNNIGATPEETRENLGIEWGKPINENMQFYGNITYTHRHSEAYENYRVSNVASGVSSYYPYGFSPLETDEEQDYGATVGLKGDHFLGFDWDISSTYGADYDKIGNKNTINTGMLQSTCSTSSSSSYYSAAGCGSSPTTVQAESYQMTQWTNNLDFRRRFNIAHAVPMTLAFGMDERMDAYQIWPGETPSYQLGGTQGYAGLAPQNSGKWSRDVWAWYMDGDFKFTKKWEVDFAGRFEHYTDVGDTPNGKISTRYDLTKRIAFRGTIATGFRAPTLAEEHFSAMNVSPNGASGLLAASSAAARSLGASPLKPERSTSESGGIVLEPIDGLHIEADVYQINIRDRIVEGGTVNGPTAVSAIEQLGFSLPGNEYNPSAVSAYYLSNGASTRTQGLDINADYTFHLHRYGTLNTTLALDLNRTTLHHNGTGSTGSPLLNAQNIAYITTAYPRSKLILNAFYTIGSWDVNLRETRWGQTTDMLSYEDWAPAAVQYSTTQFYKFVNTPRWVTDLEVGYRVNKAWHLAVGANNIFNIRPRRIPQSTNYLGAIPYDGSSMQVPFTGGYYYGRVNVSF